MIYPEHAPHAQGSSTSKAAAIVLETSGRKKSRERLIYHELAVRPRTRWELVADLGLSYENVNPRVSEMAARGILRASGETRVGKYGLQTDVMETCAPYSQKKRAMPPAGNPILEAAAMLDELILIFGVEKRDMVERSTLNKAAELSAKLKRQ